MKSKKASRKLVPVLTILAIGTLFDYGICKEKEETLPEVVVTANRLEEEIEKISAQIKIITKEEIEKKGLTFISDVFRMVSSIYVPANGGPGQTAGTILSRGTKSAHVLIMIDGFKVNDPPSGMFDFGSLTVDDIERIEITEGPFSTLYGSEAVGGVINIITKKGKGKPRVSLSLDGGSYGTLKPSVEVSGELKGFDFRVNAFHYYTDGFSSYRYGKEDDSFKTSGISTKLGFSPTSKVRLEVLGKYNYGKVEYDGWRTDAENVRKDHNYLIGLKLNLFLTESFKQIFSGYKNFSERKFYEPQGWYPYTKYTTSTEGLSLENQLSFMPSYVLIFGADLRKEKVESIFSLNQGYDKSRDHLGLFINNKLKLLKDKLILTLGLRHDDYKKFGEKTTYRIGMLYNIPSFNLKLKANYGTGFRAPSFDDLYYPGLNNPDLKPEEVKGWDVGVEKFFFRDLLKLNFVTFYHKYKNLIQSDPITWKPKNIGKASIKGFEASFIANLADNLSLKSSYVYLDPENKITKEYIAYKPLHKACLTLDYSFHKINFTLDYIYTGIRYTPNTRLAPYSLINLSTNYSVSPYLKLYLRLENLLNTDYEEVKDYGTPKRSLYGGIKINF